MNAPLIEYELHLEVPNKKSWLYKNIVVVRLMVLMIGRNARLSHP